ncbi:MAG: class I adenylate-forming enzyme family protein [Saprospiraceae bacterium]
MQLVQALRERAPNTPAIVEKGSVISVGQLLSSSEQLAYGLVNQGMSANDTVVMAAFPDAAFLQLFYASMMVGVKLAVIDPEMGRNNYQAKLQQLAPKWAFVDSRLLLLNENTLLRWIYFLWTKKGMYFPRNSGAKIIATGPRLPLFSKHAYLKNLAGPAIPLKKLPESSEFLITYTSGTTETPKGVVHSIGAITESVQQIAQMLKGGTELRLATHLPYFALIGLNAGVTAYLWRYKSSATEKLKFIEKNKITTLFSPPCDYLPLLEICEREKRKLPVCLQHLVFGSAPVHRSFLERIIAVLPDHVRLSCLYGMTENLVVAQIDGREKAKLPTDGGDILGRPVLGVKIKFGADKELFVESPQTFVRYLHLQDRGEWHPSGDLCHLDEEGRIVLTGRKKDMIIRRNFNLYPGLYESTINRIPGVTECAFVGAYDYKKLDEVVALFVECKAPLTEAYLRKQLEQGEHSIDKEAMPDLLFIQNLPRAGRQNKVDKNQLRVRLIASLK